MLASTFELVQHDHDTKSSTCYIRPVASTIWRSYDEVATHAVEARRQQKPLSSGKKAAASGIVAVGSDQ